MLLCKSELLPLSFHAIQLFPVLCAAAAHFITLSPMGTTCSDQWPLLLLPLLYSRPRRFTSVHLLRLPHIPQQLQQPLCLHSCRCSTLSSNSLTTHQSTIVPSLLLSTLPALERLSALELTCDTR